MSTKYRSGNLRGGSRKSRFSASGAAQRAGNQRRGGTRSGWGAPLRGERGEASALEQRVRGRVRSAVQEQASKGVAVGTLEVLVRVAGTQHADNRAPAAQCVLQGLTG